VLPFGLGFILIFSIAANVKFLDEITSVRAEARRLIQKENVSILIGLGHIGYGLDIKVK
jgi:2',3'-cyclic-nucleotide 2'-phosphodiesterase (5'-nucleotidase family)